MYVLATNWPEEIGKAAITFGFLVIVGGLATIVFDNAKRKRERDTAAYEEFCSTYGRFFSAWKTWETLKDVYGNRGSIPAERRANLASDVADLEGELEAVLVRVTGLRKLTSPERDGLGRLRVGFQRLRECIEMDTELEWRVVEKSEEERKDEKDKDLERPVVEKGEGEEKDDKGGSLDEAVKSYVVFKALAVELAALLSRSSWADYKTWRRPSSSEAQEALVEITSWRSDSKSKQLWASSGRKDDVVNRALGALKGAPVKA